MSAHESKVSPTPCMVRKPPGRLHFAAGHCGQFGIGLPAEPGAPCCLRFRPYRRIPSARSWPAVPQPRLRYPPIPRRRSQPAPLPLQHPIACAVPDQLAEIQYRCHFSFCTPIKVDRRSIDYWIVKEKPKFSPGHTRPSDIHQPVPQDITAPLCSNVLSLAAKAAWRACAVSLNSWLRTAWSCWIGP